MSKTPRTDAAASCGIYGELEEVSTEFARELETEITALQNLFKDLESLIERKGYVILSRLTEHRGWVSWEASLYDPPASEKSSLQFALQDLVDRHKKIDAQSLP